MGTIKGILSDFLKRRLKIKMAPTGLALVAFVAGQTGAVVGGSNLGAGGVVEARIGAAFSKWRRLDGEVTPPLPQRANNAVNM